MGSGGRRCGRKCDIGNGASYRKVRYGCRGGKQAALPERGHRNVDGGTDLQVFKKQSGFPDGDGTVEKAVLPGCP